MVLAEMAVVLVVLVSAEVAAEVVKVAKVVATLALVLAVLAGARVGEDENPGQRWRPYQPPVAWHQRDGAAA